MQRVHSTSIPSKPTAKPPVVQSSSGNAIIINPSQRLNPILQCIRNVSKEFGDIIPDYQLGRTTCALFLSLKYHRLHPEYIHQRIEKLGHAYNLRILLILCDITEHQDPLRELTKSCLINNITIMVAWTPEEAGTYLATYKAFEHRSPDSIKERVHNDYNSVLKSALTSINKVNSTDVETLRTSFGSFSNIAKANSEQLQKLPGFGQVKVRRIKAAFERPFRNNSTTAISDTPRSQNTTQAPPQQPKEASGSEKGKRKAKATAFGSAADMPPPPGPIRQQSPASVIDLDLNDGEDDDPRQPLSMHISLKPGTGGAPPTRPVAPAMERRERGPSPVWDIELDLNESD